MRCALCIATSKENGGTTKLFCPGHESTDNRWIDSPTAPLNWLAKLAVAACPADRQDLARQKYVLDKTT
jgi:hypothetical protein